MAGLQGYGAAGPNGSGGREIGTRQHDPVAKRIAAYPWPRGGVGVRRAAGGYSLLSTRTGEPVARLKPLPEGDRVEVLWWRRGAWGPAGPFGASFDLDEALAFIASEPAFWIRA
jgi:antitoxin (DNA-binding transcriptional repressor) of toxin-antitoxin stability system